MIWLKGRDMAQPVEPKKVLTYQDANGNEPFTDWLNSLRDQKGRRTILRRIGRLEHGLYGDCEPIGEGVLELRLFFGPGYRVYFGEEAGRIIILLCGGDKDTQTRDIKAAKEYWKEYKGHGKP
jgi:putative addiction module killer protein